ncbi:hypothetical protein CCAX7_39430 [Capsulimonas corticalis]|uniref:Uncharacterized protein n=1 Tax=Capsulimonas corticalis TaxID=2219043 RepID=A0A402D3M9_9BACT|nr:S-layer homology domain-containing protein [Capsulimonas corticalis]BDI31892.1 hypothetical protein CCAX7_39430 [Capsulimonas corticalis]
MSRKNSITRLSAILLGAAALAAGTAFAAPKDVPQNHWAAKSVDSVTTKRILTPNAKGNFDGDKPVTRYELAVALDRFVQYIEAGRKPLHPTSRNTKAILPAKANTEQKAALARLASADFIPANSPLLKNDDRIVTAKELKASLSAVVIRLSDRAIAPQKD